MPGENNLLIIQEITHEDGSISATIAIDQNSAILKGHFPGHPVVPGAFMLQIVKEVLEQTLNQSIRLKKADNLKFLSMVDPQVTTEVQLHMSYRAEESNIIVNAKLSSSQTLHFKFQGAFIVE